MYQDTGPLSPIPISPKAVMADKWNLIPKSNDGGDDDSKKDDHKEAAPNKGDSSEQEGSASDLKKNKQVRWDVL